MHTASHFFPLRRTAAALAVASLAFSFGSCAQGAPAGEFARGRVLVEARAGLSDTELDALVKAHGGKRRKLGQSRMQIVDLPPGLSEEDVVAKLARRPELKFAELDRKVSVTMAVNDPYIGSPCTSARSARPRPGTAPRAAASPSSCSIPA